MEHLHRIRGSRRTIRAISLCSVPLIAGATLSGQALAQDVAVNGDAETQERNEILVTAQFREQSLQDTPLSITAVNAEMLEARGQTNVQEIANQVPSVTLKPAAGSWGPSLVANIRGVGQYNFHPALEPGVGVFLDDVYFATLTGSMLDLVDVERIEVLRGPQGTLSGRNSIGGAIRIISQKPTFEDSGYAQVTVGSDSLVGVRGSMNLALGDTVAIRVSGVSNDQDGYVERLDFGCVNPGQGVPSSRSLSSDCKLGSDMGGVGSRAARGMLRFQPSSDLDLVLSIHHVRESHTGPGEVLTFANKDDPITNPAPGIPLDSRFICGEFCNYSTYQNPAGPPGYFAYPVSVDPVTQYRETGASAHFDLDLSERVAITSITAYREYQTKFASDGDLSPASRSLDSVDLHHRFFSQEARLNAQLDPLELTVGGYYSWQRSHMQAFFDLRPAFTQYTTDDPVPVTTAATFATAILSVTDRLTLTGGIRYTHEKKDYTFFRYNLDGTVAIPGLQGVTGTAKDSVVDYRVSLDYRWSPEVLTYVTFSTGFKGGGINPLPRAPILARPFGPETLNNFEAGIKADLFENRARLNIAGFFNEYDGVQLTRLSCPELNLTPCGIVMNAGDAEVKGVEIELMAEPVDGFQLDAAFSYLDFEFTTIDPGTFLPITVVPPFTPSTKWSGGAQYTVDIGDGGEFTARIDASYQSSIYTNALNGDRNKIPSYTVANASLTWMSSDGDWTLRGYVSNLFDKYYYLNLFDTSGFVGVVRAQPGRPREYRISLTKRF